MYVLQILCAASLIVLVPSMSAGRKTKATSKPIIPTSTYTSLKDYLKERTESPNPSYGYWNMTIRSALSLSDDDGMFCDIYTKCDTYVKIRVDGRVVWRSKTHWNEPLPKFFESYHSPRMKKDSLIQIEMWDDDSGGYELQSDDDFMDRWWSKSAAAISRNKLLVGRRWETTISPNKLFIESRWIDD